MRKLLGILIASVGLSLVAVDADARRMSGGKSIGKQREAINPNQAAPKAPAQQQAAPAQKATPATPPPQQPSGWRRFLGPLAGLAIGAMLASLFLNNGLGGALMGILLLAALVMGAVFLFRLFRGTRPTEPLRYAGATPSGGREPVSSAPIAYAPAPHSVAAATQAQPAAASSPWPADFDAEAFVRHARLNFVNLQSAHDRKDLAAIRDFLTPEMYREIEASMKATGDAPQKTEIVTLEAEVLDVATEGDLYIVSVRFSGLIRETEGGEAQPLSEVWHLEKPVNGRSGWLVSGIQQAS
jgi:predicted lipid-binding transport protein (Tim44 family)